MPEVETLQSDLFAEVAVPAAVTSTYTYRIPLMFHAQAEPGCRVVVPFGRQTLVGYVVAIHEQPPPDLPLHDLKAITHWIDETPIINAEILALTRWVADYYYAPWGETLKAALPAGLDIVLEEWVVLTDAGRQAVAQGTSRSREQHLLAWLAKLGGESLLDSIPKDFGTKPRQLARDLERDGFVSITVRPSESRVRAKQRLVARLPNHTATPASPAQARVIHCLLETQTKTLTDLARQAQVSPAVLRQMAKKGLIEISPETVRRDPLAHLADLPSTTPLELTAEQRQAYEAVLDAHDRGRFQTFLLHGVTGSGKTEVYLAAISAVVERGGSALMLAPEIGLTPMLSRRLIQRFGPLVALLHSSLSPGERVDEWERIRSGAARVVIGTRSAVFAPLVNLRLIVVDEEHDASYKQSEGAPHYHGRDTAILRASRLGCPVLLGSATPAVETFQNALSGKYTRLVLSQRIGNRTLPEVTLVDMRKVFERHHAARFVSDELQTAIAETCAQGEQVMVLLNRRGFASCWLCRECGFVAECPQCSVTLTYHRADHYLTCHYCGYTVPPPRRCPTCRGEGMAYIGEGTEQLETRLRELFPTLSIARLDRDTTRRRGAFERIFNDFATGSLDILVGTQMIAKGHDFPNVTLVGVVSVDAGLMMPDFRAPERIFQLIAQVSGRAGRGDRPGRVIVQTYRPEHYALAAGCQQDYEAFFAQEIIQRREAYYPPFCALANVMIRHERELEGQALAEKAACYLRALTKASARWSPESVRVLGPALAPLARLRGEYRFQILLKSRQRRQARQALERLLPELTDTERRHVFIEIDPIDLM
ncbi:primosomal protein N' [Chloracidobacterium validum]|uniref:Replication restart protein PriA n=1 Tax=Chloracidobacterium validum TaxID=2821543 RepID=A0ABX8B6V9_9BACT|nr:primosomal protein N' [Chloracidobacterium validum]QUW02371.1 primosomal protein N' [Chloracidobacterium validum]